MSRREMETMEMTMMVRILLHPCYCFISFLFLCSSLHLCSAICDVGKDERDAGGDLEGYN